MSKRKRTQEDYIKELATINPDVEVNITQKMYCEETHGGEYDLVYEVNGKVVDRRFVGSFENVMLECYDFFKRNSEKYGLESRVNTLVVKLDHTFY